MSNQNLQKVTILVLFNLCAGFWTGQKNVCLFSNRSLSHWASLLRYEENMLWDKVYKLMWCELCFPLSWTGSCFVGWHAGWSCWLTYSIRLCHCRYPWVCTLLLFSVSAPIPQPQPLDRQIQPPCDGMWVAVCATSWVTPPNHLIIGDCYHPGCPPDSRKWFTF